MAHFLNETLFGAKCWDLFGGMADEQKPDCGCIAEAHLRSTDLNVARRRLKKLGWRSFGTQAISKIAKETGLLPNAPQEGPQGRFHNSGGELVLLGAHLQASGHHQPVDAAGYRSVIVRFKGWSLHLVCLYLDSLQPRGRAQ